MKIRTHDSPISSFLSTEKDLALLCHTIGCNKRLQKYLYYTNDRPLENPDLTQEEINSLFGEQIKIVPKFYIDGSIMNYIVISQDSYVTNATNPEFRNSLIEIDIICHYDQWQLKDFELRPYKIAGELDSMLDGAKFSGIGTLNFVGATKVMFTDEYAGLCVFYQAIHGIEDKKGMPNPLDEAQFVQDYNEMIEKQNEQ